MDLLGELAGGGDDEGARHVTRSMHQFVQNGQHEGRRFSGAGLRRTDDVIAMHGNRDGLFLDGGGLAVACPLDARREACVQVEL